MDTEAIKAEALNEHSQAQNANKIWTTVGSTGTVDETDVSKVFFDHSVVQVGRLVADPIGVNSERTTDYTPVANEPVTVHSSTESAVIRYNVTPVDGLLYNPAPPCQPGTPCLGIQMELRYLAAGTNAQVVAKLIEVDLETGAETIRLAFDSSHFDVADHYQVQSIGECGPSWHFDFTSKAYYIEATLTHSSIISGNAAGIQMIKIEKFFCPG